MAQRDHQAAFQIDDGVLSLAGALLDILRDDRDLIGALAVIGDAICSIAGPGSEVKPTKKAGR